MKFKVLFLSVSILVMYNVCSAQSFFKPVPKIKQQRYALTVAGTTKDSTINAFRPVVNLAAYSLPGNQLMTGAGVSYQHLKYDPVTTKWEAIWSISAIQYIGTVVSNLPNGKPITATGIMAGLLNNLFMAGVAIDNNTGKFMTTVGLGISLNN